MYSKVANFILSDKHNRALPGEKHQIIYLPDGTYNPAVYSGPGTNLETRLKRGDEPLSAVDKEAQAHDIRYLLAKTEDDVKKADEIMIEKLNDVRARNLDSNFNINQAELIRLKYYANKLGVPTSFFTSFGHGDSQAEQDLIPIAESKLTQLQQAGYGKSRPRRLYKDDKGYYYKKNDEGLKSYIKTGSNTSGRDLYIINLQNQRPVPRKAPTKKDTGDKDSEDKPTKMIPKISGGSGSIGNIGVPATKQEIVNAYAEGVNANPKAVEYKGLLDKYKDLQSQIQITEDENDRKKLEQELQVEADAIRNYDLPDDDKEQARLENLSTYTPSQYSTVNPRRMLPFVGDSPSEYGTDSQYSSGSDTQSSSDTTQSPPDIPQPVVQPEPIVETDELQPLDNTPTEDNISALEEKLGRQIKNPIEDAKLSEPEKESIESVGMSFEDLQSARQQPYKKKSSLKKPTVGFTEDTKDIIEEEPSESKIRYFSAIKKFDTKINILLGEADLSDNNRIFLENVYDRESKKVKSKTDRDTINILWAEYSITVPTKDQKAIIDRYSLQIGMGIKSLNKVNDEGLKTSDIEKLMKKYNHINLPVIASNMILSLRKYINKNTKLFSFIMNLDPSDKPGSHWVAVILDNRDKYVGYYDSLCIHPTQHMLDDIKELIRSMDEENMFKLKFNTVQDQGKDSGKCGLYAMGFLHNILNGMSFKRASGYMDRDYKDGEKKIDKLMNGFGFI